MWFSVAVVDSLDIWDVTPIVFNGFVICVIVIFMGLSFFGVPFFPNGGMIYFWVMDFVPTLVINVAVILRHAYRMMA